MIRSEEQHPVYFVGAGPGDPDLITVKGRRLLKEAQIIVYAGSLVPKALVEGLAAELHDSAGLNLEEIVSIMVKGVQDGKRVVRLHTGDPAFYGAIREQMAILAEQNVSYGVVPGVSSANAAAAALTTELTLPEVSQTVIITRRAGRTPVPEKEDLQSLAAHQATMMIFLSVGMIEDVVRDLVAGGYGLETPVAVVEKVSWPEERVLTGTLATIAGQVKEAEIKKTAIIAVGEVFRQGPLAAVSKLYDQTFSHEYRK
ncbi:MAG: precorrin-4 C(11)-methyltransferase [Thermodesulfobacteriota bacterium]